MSNIINTNTEIIRATKDLKVVNLTPHDVNIYSGTVYDDSIGKYIGGVRIAHFPRSGRLASAINRYYSPVMVELQEGAIIPLVRREIIDVTNLGEDDENTIYIVSSVAGDGAGLLNKAVNRVFTPHGQVFNPNTGKQIGCTGLIRYTEDLDEALFDETAFAG